MTVVKPGTDICDGSEEDAEPNGSHSEGGLPRGQARRDAGDAAEGPTRRAVVRRVSLNQQASPPRQGRAKCPALRYARG